MSTLARWYFFPVIYFLYVKGYVSISTEIIPSGRAVEFSLAFEMIHVQAQFTVDENMMAFDPFVVAYVIYQYIFLALYIFDKCQNTYESCHSSILNTSPVI